MNINVNNIVVNNGGSVTFVATVQPRSTNFLKFWKIRA